MDHSILLAKEIGIREEQAKVAIQLLDEGNTVPFIARYRKEMTGSLDDEQLRRLSERLTYLRGLDQRKSEVLSSIEGQGKLTEELKEAIEKAVTLAEVEDLYRPYKPKRRTRASIAKEKGLEPLAEAIWQQNENLDPEKEAEKYLNAEKGVETVSDAIAGALDILAEQISDDPEYRKKLKTLLHKKALLSSKKAEQKEETENAKDVYAMYAEYEEPVAKMPGHRILAVNRGEKEGVLKVSITPLEEEALLLLKEICVKNESPSAKLIEETVADAYKRLLFPSLEREIRAQLTEQASEQAMGVFRINLRQLLMQPPVAGHVTLGLDPAYRTGCKIAVVDETGKVLDTTVVYPTPPQNRIEEAKAKLKQLIKKYHVSCISIGNGTASRESEDFVAEMLGEMDIECGYVVVSEAGASVYSASKLAAQEFPDFDVTQRSAVSIARRLQDPLAELVKIDPKSIGVGQYQHDMPPARLDEALGGVVEDCVNAVGVDLNTASAPLLTQISGISSAVAKNIVAYREENGAFTSRKQLKKVPKLGDKAFEQSAGFLRVAGGKEPLDNTGIHPESYEAAKALLETGGFTPTDVRNKDLSPLNDVVMGKKGEELAEKLGIGVITLRDIAKELQKPARDPREELPPPVMKTRAMKLEDLAVGTVLQGTVRNVVDFGAFVDIGVHDDGLVHISQICNKFIRHPSEVLKIGDVVKVQVISVDVAKHRIGLTMKNIKEAE